jgi:hypothetical protein
MIVYHYDPVTMAYTGSEDARPDPLEHRELITIHLENGGHPEQIPAPEKYLLPANATFFPPPVLRKGEIAVFDPKKTKWTVQAAPEPKEA